MKRRFASRKIGYIKLTETSSLLQNDSRFRTAVPNAYMSLAGWEGSVQRAVEDVAECRGKHLKGAAMLGFG